MWEAKVIKAEDIVFEDGIGQEPVMARYGRIVRQPLSGGLGFGIIECDDMAEDWFQNYDQILYILEGNFRCIIDGKVYEGVAGDTIFIPKDTQLRYETTGKARLLYIVYPEGNMRWRSLIGKD
ncbi:MAG: cupin domain-containing protein [Alphaproteobacteria bacterium]|nr:cupin domain-containing protein [Alphaproteobacteria bacterium]MDP6876431.1 cupin domain-containing protein [Alphaproteobacteria bacterium]